MTQPTAWFLLGLLLGLGVVSLAFLIAATEAMLGALMTPTNDKEPIGPARNSLLEQFELDTARAEFREALSTRDTEIARLYSEIASAERRGRLEALEICAKERCWHCEKGVPLEHPGGEFGDNYVHVFPDALIRTTRICYVNGSRQIIAALEAPSQPAPEGGDAITVQNPFDCVNHTAEQKESETPAKEPFGPVVRVSPHFRT